MSSYICIDCGVTTHTDINAPTRCDRCAGWMCEDCGAECDECGAVICDSDECGIREMTGSFDPQEQVFMCGACRDRIEMEFSKADVAWEEREERRREAVRDADRA